VGLAVAVAAVKLARSEAPTVVVRLAPNEAQTVVVRLVGSEAPMAVVKPALNEAQMVVVVASTAERVAVSPLSNSVALFAATTVDAATGMLDAAMVVTGDIAGRGICGAVCRSTIMMAITTGIAAGCVAAGKKLEVDIGVRGIVSVANSTNRFCLTFGGCASYARPFFHSHFELDEPPTHAWRVSMTTGQRLLWSLTVVRP
jgi:hypothetical protein